jgi:lipid-binding SYLF domain-containing protein
MRGLAIAASFFVSTGLWAADSAQDRLNESASVFSEIMGTPDKGIPQDLLSKAECVIVIPNLKKAAFVVGGQYGRGFAECRKANGAGWGSPAAVKLEGGSVGFQIGGSETDLIMLVMNRRGMDKLAKDKVTLGADASIAAGPVGRTAAANTDLKMDAEILAWSRSKGLFAGISLNGASLREDKETNNELYGHSMTNREVLASTAAPPPAAQPLISALDKYSSRSSNADRTAH